MNRLRLARTPFRSRKAVFSFQMRAFINIAQAGIQSQSPHGAEPVQPDGPQIRKSAGILHPRADRPHSLVSTRHRRPGQTERTGDAFGQAAERAAVTGRAGLAAQEISRHDPDPPAPQRSSTSRTTPPQRCSIRTTIPCGNWIERVVEARPRRQFDMNAIERACWAFEAPA
jgi:hypothetical protein